MRPKKENKRDKTIFVRVTEDELERLTSDMRSQDYLCMSVYLRDVLLRRKVTVQKYHITDRSIRNQINDISAKISKIGTNYNQLVKKVNELAVSKRKNGDPVINSKFLSYYLDKLQTATTQLLAQHNRLVDQVDLIQLDEASE
jgi:predicted DNA binding CopG/RHH family protein